jgi:hypothetical protein
MHGTVGVVSNVNASTEPPSYSPDCDGAAAKSAPNEATIDGSANPRGPSHVQSVRLLDISQVGGYAAAFADRPAAGPQARRAKESEMNRGFGAVARRRAERGRGRHDARWVFRLEHAAASPSISN